MGDEICVVCKIEIQNREISAPETLWFKLPASYKDYVDGRSDPFAVAMLPTAMALGEDMEVRGHVSPRLAFGIQEYQQVQHSWWPNQLTTIYVKYSRLGTPGEIENNGAVGCAFSGGVDSFYSLWRHLPENEKIPEYRVTHCLIINGFDHDVDLDNAGYFQKINQNYEPMMHDLGIKLMTISTNLQQFRLVSIGRSHLHQSFGVPITASALILGRLFTRFYIPGSYPYSNLTPEGAHPILDHLLSTEYMEIIHDGAKASRVQKTATIAQWPETFSRLRVCFKKTNFREETNFIENCCRCEKCIRTMISLDLIGFLHKYDTFPLPLKRRYIRKINYLSEGSQIFAKENMILARRTERKKIAFDMQCALFRSQIIKKAVLPVFNRLPNHVKSWLRG